MTASGTSTLRASALCAAAAVVSILGGADRLAAADRDGVNSPYRVTPKTAGLADGVTTYEAADPVGGLRFEFNPSGLIEAPHGVPGAWVLDFKPVGTAIDGRLSLIGPARLSASENRVDYEFEAMHLSYRNDPDGLRQTVTIKEPAGHVPTSVEAAGELEWSIGGTLHPVMAGYFVNLVDDAGAVALRIGPLDAKSADGTTLGARFELATNEQGRVTGIRILIDASDASYPVEVAARLTSPSVAKTTPDPAQTSSKEIVGIPVTLQRGITVTVDDMMARERLSPAVIPAVPRETHHEQEEELELKEDPNAPPPLSHWPPIQQAASTGAPAGPPDLPQPVGVSFKGTGISESGFIPPDSMGDVGPSQILVHVNGRVKVFDKTGVLGPLNVSDATFWAPVYNGISDPEVRYDRLSGRWFLLAITLESTNNRIVVAVSSGAVITGLASFTYYQFNIGTPSPNDFSSFCDYPGFGVDANALYTGCNMFGGTFHTTAYVIRKTSVLSGGPIVVTGFYNIGDSSSAGPYAPRGVDNDDPTWNEGYIIGTDAGFTGRINLRRVSNPGGSPTLGPTITLSVSNTNLLNQSASGSGTPLDASNIKLYAASIHKNKITGATTLWTAQSVETDTTCMPAGSGNNRRLGAKWYEIGNLTATPTILQFGTLCTTAVGAATSNTERGFLYPTVAASGQGHMALGATFASAAEFAGVSTAGRFRTDPSGGTRAPETVVLAGSAPYQLLENSGRNRWGDYSFTDVDPNDDMTLWTFQEYADTPANNWSLRAVQLKAPPPPNIVTTSNAVCAGVTASPVTVNGSDSCAAPTCTNGLCTGGGACPEFFDPGPDTGGPGYANHITATVTGGITVNSANIVIPAAPSTHRVLSVALSLNTLAATPGNKTVTITNPDGQSKFGNVITVIANRAPVANAGGPYAVCQASSVTLDGTASTDPDAICGDTIVSYEWDLNNDGTFDVTGATPVVTAAQLTALGLVVGANTIKLRVTDSHSATNTGSGTLTILTDGSACSDGNACTQTDVCQSGLCVGSNPVVCPAPDPCHDPGVCNPGTGVCSNPSKTDGSACTDGNACTQTDTCQSGVCISGNPVVCTASDQCHLAGTCDTGTGICSNPAKGDGVACDDADATTCGDVCASGSCAGHAVAAPQILDDSLHLDRSPTDTTLSWTDVPGPYGVYRGVNGPAGAPWSYNHTCLDPGVSGTSVVDTDVPAAGTFFYYLVTRWNECRESAPGLDGQSNPIPNSSPCPPP